MAKREMKTVKTEEQIIEETVVETPEAEEAVEPTILYGVVSGCSRLNVRKKPNVKADVIKVINANHELTINKDKSNKDWYYVNVDGVVLGYCMKKYITVK